MRLEDLKQALAAAPDATLLVDQRGDIAAVNGRFCDLFGYAADEASGLSIEQLLPGGDTRAEHRNLRMQYMTAPKPHIVAAGRELWAVRKDGEQLPVDVALGPVELDEGRYVVASIREISRILNLRSALQETEQWNQAVLSSLQDHIVLLDEDGCIRTVNPAWEQFARDNASVPLKCLGVGANFLEECRRAAGAGDESARQVLDAVATALRSKQPVTNLEYRCLTEEQEFWFRMSVLPVGGKCQGVVICQSDFTELKSTEIRRRAAIEELTALKERLRAENLYLHEKLDRKRCCDEIIGQSGVLEDALRMVASVAGTEANVLLLGETGTGKELFAREIHQRSRRAKGPLVTINCAALPSSLIESEMFGHVRGAFTGAIRDTVGRFELAHGGTLFLDEIGEIDIDLQAKLLRVLEEREFEKIGSSKTIKANVRIIAATNRDLEHDVRNGKFRADLFFRLAVFPIKIPPLRRRVQDIPLLIWHFVANKSGDLGKKITVISERAMQACMGYDWPGNVRELENVVERAMILSPGNELLLEKALMLPTSSGSSPEAAPTTMEQVGKAHIIRVLEACDWIIKGPGNAADQLGMAPSTLRYRMRKLGIETPQRR
jgi:PAS domain S-box-containing protein